MGKPLPKARGFFFSSSAQKSELWWISFALEQRAEITFQSSPPTLQNHALGSIVTEPMLELSHDFPGINTMARVGRV
jgi:hypothetical protein